MAADHFCLRWNNYQSNMVSELDILRTEEYLVDVTLCCEGNKFRAHKVILSACSPYFRNVFKENPCEHPVVILKDVSPEDVEALLSFVYQGVVYVSEKKLCSFLQTAELLQIKGLAGAASSLSDEQAKAAIAQQSPVKRRKSAPVRILKQEDSGEDTNQNQLMEAEDDASRSNEYSEEMMEDVKNEEDEADEDDSEGEIVGGGVQAEVSYPSDRAEGDERLAGTGGGGGPGGLMRQEPGLHLIQRLSAQHQSSLPPGQYQVPGSGQPPLPELLSPPGESRNGRRPCPLCTKVISNKSNLLKHMRIRHSDAYNPACCVLCNKIFKNKYSLRAHLNIYHKEYIAPPGTPQHQGSPMQPIPSGPMPTTIEQIPQPQYLPTGV